MRENKFKYLIKSNKKTMKKNRTITINKIFKNNLHDQIVCLLKENLVIRGSFKEPFSIHGLNKSAEAIIKLFKKLTK